ncbi:response regulator transcription factor [Asticcacaulis sp. 201]|uniref:response regulator transcription factor n=1 Tax=Asticcacaulis sp. 201 TaxID=3028787 RepID=UPI0029161B84|nr:response regulator transcription factor [Asticcacaulis sp. 201]MDV6332171.1 response regulator transcription factor [Asticcacaulis sp. 201]
MLYPRSTKHRILVVDDMEDIRDLVSIILVKNGYDVLTADGGAQMDVVLSQKRVDLIILDTMMPLEDGLSICKRLSTKSAPPIIMLSARGQDIDRIKGLDLGAEDYIAKPFNADELVARVRVVLRRFHRPDLGDAQNVDVFGWRLDAISRVITSPVGLSLALSSTEFAVIRVLFDNPDRPLKRLFILDRIADMQEHSTARALDTLISRLRRKLASIHPNADSDDELVRTVYGVGYMLKPENG